MWDEGKSETDGAQENSEGSRDRQKGRWTEGGGGRGGGCFMGVCVRERQEYTHYCKTGRCLCTWTERRKINVCVHLLTESKQVNVINCNLIPLLRGCEHHKGKETEDGSNRLMSSLPRNSGEQLSCGFMFTRCKRATQQTTTCPPLNQLNCLRSFSPRQSRLHDKRCVNSQQHTTLISIISLYNIFTSNFLWMCETSDSLAASDK